MYLLTILAYVILLWHAEAPSQWRLLGEEDVLWTAVIVLAQPPLLGLAAWAAGRRTRRLLSAHSEAAQHDHHRSMLWLRAATVVGFGFVVFATGWPLWFAIEAPTLQIVGDLAVLSPFVAGVLAIWLAAFPIERDLRAQAVIHMSDRDGIPGARWRLRTYLDFNLRHHVLIVAVPMTLILYAANVTRGYEHAISEWAGWVWAPDALLGLTALAVFLIAPVLLIRIWRTSPLDAGPMRERLEALCRAVGLRARDILVWKSDGVTINAAVTGVFAPVRYVLLSDGLLATMDVGQIEAVFGHEAGHVKHRHIQHLLVFALVGWLLAAGLMECTARLVAGPPTDATVVVSAGAIEGIQALGVAVTVLYWGLGFGWLSRNFERQADLFGAQCVTPDPGECALPCGVHLDTETSLEGPGRVCASGAALFAHALDRVALLNGIPREERSWRHSSVGSRIRFLAGLAGDPSLGAAFERRIRRVKWATLLIAGFGSALWLYYWTVIPQPGIVQLGAGAP
jgi:STE24 endopeptidase